MPHTHSLNITPYMGGLHNQLRVETETKSKDDSIQKLQHKLYTKIQCKLYIKMEKKILYNKNANRKEMQHKLFTKNAT